MQGLRTDIVPQPLEALSEKTPVRDVACGLGHALFLMANGRVCSWGNGGNGRLGLGDTTDRAEACMIKGEIYKTEYMCAVPGLIVVW
jgi:alpha-tubulin suppressor-like RCC1 family protein